MRFIMFEDKIKTFGIVKDPNPYEMVETAGFIKDGKNDGFGWSQIDRLAPCDHVRLYTSGLVPDYSVEALCGVVYFDQLWAPKGADKVTLRGESPEKHLLIELDEEGRISFCGMHENGVRNGLGSEFIYDDKGFKERQGLWQNGKLTHLRKDDKLVPVE